MDKHILLGVIPVDEAIPRLDIEPLDGASNLGSDHLFGFLLFNISSSLLL